jgi:hypothetical protein
MEGKRTGLPSWILTRRRMSWSWMGRPRGLYRLLTPVIARVGRRQERENWGGLKRFLEAREELAPEAS